MANIVSTRSLREQMTGKERLEAALRLDEVDRIPWAPKVFIGHYRSGTSSAHQSMSIAEFASVLHCDAIAWDSLVKARSTNVTQEIVRDGLVTSRITTTPVGEIVSASTRSPDTHSSHPTEFPLKSPSDYEVAKYIAEHTTFEPAAGVHEQALASVGDRGIVVTTGPGTPLMTMIQNTVGMPHIYFHMADHRQEFDELFEAEAANWLRHYEAIAQTDAIPIADGKAVAESVAGRRLSKTVINMLYAEANSDQPGHLGKLGRVASLIHQAMDLTKSDQLQAGDVEAAITLLAA